MRLTLWSHIASSPRRVEGGLAKERASESLYALCLRETVQRLPCLSKTSKGTRDGRLILWSEHWQRTLKKEFECGFLLELFLEILEFEDESKCCHVQTMKGKNCQTHKAWYLKKPPKRNMGSKSGASQIQITRRALPKWVWEAWDHTSLTSSHLSPWAASSASTLWVAKFRAGRCQKTVRAETVQEPRAL